MFGSDKALVAQLRADLAAADAALVQERARYDALLHTVLAMKTAGARVVAAVGSAVEPEPIQPAKPADPLLALIDEQCGRDVAKRRMMLRQLAVDRAARVSEEEIAESILHGVQNEGGVPE